MFTELGWTWDLCDHSWSQPFLGHPADSDVPPLGHKYLPSVSSCPVCVEQGSDTRQGDTSPARKNNVQEQTHPCSHPPPSPRAAESTS